MSNFGHPTGTSNEIKNNIFVNCGGGEFRPLIAFDGTLSSWWTKIVIGALLFIFCVVQRLMALGAARKA